MDFSSVHTVHHLLSWDYVVIVAVLTVSAAIGIYYSCTGGKQRTTQEFYMADHSMGIFPTALSLLGSLVNAIMILGTASEVYYYDTSFWYIALSFIITIPVAAFVYVPVFYKLEVTSAYEYLEKRFNKNIRRLGSIIFISQTILMTSVILYTPSLAVSQVTGINLWTCILTLGAICIFYTTMGGIKAVMWSDALQIVVMYGCLISVVVVGTINLGGFGVIWEKAVEGNRIRLNKINPHPFVRHSIWSLVIGGGFIWMSYYCTSQAFVQRYLATSSIKKAQIALFWNVPCMILFVTLSVFGGLIVYAAYWNCNPLQTKRISKPDQLMPLFVMDMFSSSPGFPGLFIAGCFSGALSTISSSIHALSSVVVKDFIKPILWMTISDKHEVLLSKFMTICFGILCIALVVVAERMETVIVMAYNVGGVLGGPLLGLFTLGIFYPKSNSIGASIGVICSLIFSMWIAIGSMTNKTLPHKNFVSVEGCNWTEFIVNYGNNSHQENNTIITNDDVFPLYKISHMWYGLISFVVVMVIGGVLSFATESAEVVEHDPILISPIVGKFSELWNTMKCRKNAKEYHLKPGFSEEKCKEAIYATENSFKNTNV